MEYIGGLLLFLFFYISGVKVFEVLSHPPAYRGFLTSFYE